MKSQAASAQQSHRLDRPVTGVMVCIAPALERISNQFQQRQWRRILGLWKVKFWRRSTWLIRCVSTGEARSEICADSVEQAKQAVLHYRVMKREAGKSWLSIELETGRTHQIRLQCGSRGFPIVGDTLYGAQTTFGSHHEDERRRCIALHSRRLKIRHPMIDEYVQQVAPVPATWEEAGIFVD